MTEAQKTDPPKRKRRCFQFSLRSLLMGVTLLAMPCAYVGWQARIVRERKAIKANLYSLGGSCMTANQYRQWIATGVAVGRRIDPVPTISWLRESLGDDPVVGIYMPALATQSEEAEITDAFPEAIVSHVQLMSNW